LSASRAALFLALALGGAGCVYAPEGTCEASSDCAAGERCEGGVCVSTADAGRDPAGVETTTFTAVAWDARDGAPGVTFSVDSVGADLAGNVVVAGAVDAPYDFDPGAVQTGAFVLKRDPSGAAVAAAGFPSFSHGTFRTAVLPGGEVFFAGTAFDPTFVVTLLPGSPGGALVVGQLDPALVPSWGRSIQPAGPASPLVPVAVAASGAGDLLVAGTGGGDFGCPGGETAGASFVAAFREDGSCWSRGLTTRTLSDVEARDDGGIVIAGTCPPPGPSLDPGGATSCTEGLFVALLSGADGSTVWATTTDAGTVDAVRDLAVAPDGRATVVGDARGLVDFGKVTFDFGAQARSFAVTFDVAGVSAGLVVPIEAPYAAEPDALAMDRCAYDRLGRLWVAGRYLGQPTLAGLRFTGCRPPECAAAAFLARLEGGPNPAVTSFLPLRAAPDAEGAAVFDDLALFATTGTVAHALRFTGTAAAPAAAPAWTSAGGYLGIVTFDP
jgi:hypothetical protein